MSGSISMRKSSLALFGVAAARAFSTYAKKLGDSMMVELSATDWRLRAWVRESKAKRTRMSRVRDIAFSIRN